MWPFRSSRQIEALLLASRPNAFDPDAAVMRRSAFAQGRSCRRGRVQPHRWSGYMLQRRWNRFFTSCPEMISRKDTLVGGRVVGGLPLAAAGVLANGGW